MQSILETNDLSEMLSLVSPRLIVECSSTLLPVHDRERLLEAGCLTGAIIVPKPRLPFSLEVVRAGHCSCIEGTRGCIWQCDLGQCG